jgi:hypothetical protein
MRQIDMSRAAVTARLKLVSELRRLCLSLQSAAIKPRSKARDHDRRDPKQPLKITETERK